MYRSFVNPHGTVTTESVGVDYQAQEGELVTADEPTAAQIIMAFSEAALAAEKAKARFIISASAEHARLQFVTPGSAKAMAYQEKAKEAQDFLADPDRGQEGHAAEMYPLIYAEVGITAEAADGVAIVIAGRYQAFKSIEAEISRTEAAAQKQVKDALDVATILATVDGLTWPTPEEE